MGAGATFDWTFFDNSNRRKELRRPFKSCDLRLGFSSTWEQQLSKIKLVEEKKEKD